MDGFWSLKLNLNLWDWIESAKDWEGVESGLRKFVSFDHWNNSGAIYVKKDEFILDENSFFWDNITVFLSKLHWFSIIVSFAKTASRKIAVFITLFVYKCTVQLCTEYCFHVWASSLFGYVGHCIKSVLIRSFSGRYFPAFRLYVSVFSANAEKYGPENSEYGL